MLELGDWRRRIFELYRGVRRNPDPKAPWLAWRAARDALFRNHPQSPVPPEERASFRGLSYFDYDPAMRGWPA